MQRRSFLKGLAAVGTGIVPLSNIAHANLRRVVPPSPYRAFCVGDMPRTLAVVADTQRTGVLERVMLGREQNDAERFMILRSIADVKPDALLMLGDQVCGGDDGEAWEHFNLAMAPVRELGIPIRAMRGNHEYEGRRRDCFEYFAEHFPDQHDDILHHKMRLGSVLLITLNSNFSCINPESVRRQAQDFKKWLDEADADPEVKTVIVASHHPPYTNSDLGSDDEVIAQFARPFEKATKTALFLSGHVHSYERFIVEGKHYITAGGGGGPRRDVRNDSGRPFTTDAYTRGTWRPFHYLTIDIEPAGLDVRTHMLLGNEFVVGDGVRIPYALA